MQNPRMTRLLRCESNLKKVPVSTLLSVMFFLALFTIIAPSNAFAEDNTLSIQYEDQIYDVETSLTNGVVSSMELDTDFTSIILDVETSDGDGSLTITLPRALIDARNGDGTSDEEFIVVVGSNEVEYSEDGTTDTERVLIIGVSAGTERIEIVGTQVVPEFPIAIVLLAIFLSFVIGLGGKRKGE